MKYEKLALKAIDHELSPATPEQACEQWKGLGVSRQTKWNWQTDPSRVPMMARFAAAWLIHADGAK